MKMMRNHDQHHDSRVLYELSYLILNILRSPPISSSSYSCSWSPMVMSFDEISRGALASLMLGISLTLMLCGSVTFFIGFMLLPWILPFLFLFAFLSTLSLPRIFQHGSFCKDERKCSRGNIATTGRWVP